MVRMISAKQILEINCIKLKSDAKTKWPEYSVEDTSKMVRREDTKN